MKKLAAGDFKARCLAVMAEVLTTGEPILVTKRGKPLVKVVPAQAPGESLFGFLKGKGEIVGDIESPIPVEWKVMKE